MAETKHERAGMIDTITLAALLHDIGKVVQRATGQRIPHSRLGADYIGNLGVSLPEKDKILECIMHHHHSEIESARLPENSPAYIIYEADNIAAGADRRGRDGEEEGIAGIYRPLEPVFNLINKAAGEGGSIYRYRLQALDDRKDSIYAGNYPTAKDIPATAAEYGSLLERFGAVMTGLDFSRDRVESLMELLEATTTFVPSSTLTGEVADISLYDHLKLTAAVACCMYLHFAERGVSGYKEHCFGPGREKARNEKYFMLVSGDLSGIQNFIYTISSKGALRSLRGRSFYLEMLLENIAGEMLRGLGLTMANLLYTGGGHFYLLAPGTDNAEKFLAAAENKINGWLLENFHTSLYLALARERCSATELTGQGEKSRNTGDIFKKLSSKLSLKKLSRYGKEQLKKLMDPDSSLNFSGEKERECAVCGTSSQKIARIEHFGEEMDLCGNCRAFMEFGGNLPDLGDRKNTRVLAVAEDSHGPGEIQTKLPSADGETLYATLAGMDEAENSIRQKGRIFRRIYSINRLITGNATATNIWMGNYAAAGKDGEGIADFKTLAEKSGGINRIAVLRADVDSLGAVFTGGFGKAADGAGYSTLSRYAALSRSLSLFFKGYINHICMKKLAQETPPFSLHAGETGGDAGERQLVISYSGGDDIFIVGSWDQVIEFAVDLRRCFKAFSCGSMTLSAGIGFFRPGFPVCQMAEITGGLEKAAKKMDGKDSIALFGMDAAARGGDFVKTARHLYKWEDFINGVCVEKFGGLNQWFNFNDEHRPGKIRASRAFVYKLLKLARENLDDRLSKGGGMPLARLAYTLARAEPESPDPHIMEVYRRARESIYRWYCGPEDCRQLITALSLIIYKHRKGDHHE